MVRDVQYLTPHRVFTFLHYPSLIRSLSLISWSLHSFPSSSSWNVSHRSEDSRSFHCDWARKCWWVTSFTTVINVGNYQEPELSATWSYCISWENSRELAWELTSIYSSSSLPTISFSLPFMEQLTMYTWPPLPSKINISLFPASRYCEHHHVCSGFVGAVWEQSRQSHSLNTFQWFHLQNMTSFYCASFTVPFTLMIIHFLYRYWAIKWYIFISKMCTRGSYLQSWSYHSLLSTSLHVSVCVVQCIGICDVVREWFTCIMISLFQSVVYGDLPRIDFRLKKWLVPGTFSVFSDSLEHPPIRQLLLLEQSTFVVTTETSPTHISSPNTG